MNDTLIVIPARGGSVGIPRKAVRTLGTKPVLRWTLDTCHALKTADVVVITEDAEIRALAETAGAGVLAEPPGIPGARTLDPVIYAAVQQQEANRGQSYAKVATVQCTVPFLSGATIQACLQALDQHESALTVMDDRHLRLGEPWVIRQEMVPCWRVTGGCIATRREHITPTRRFKPDGAFPVIVSGPEALDLDTMEDWAIAEQYAGMTVRERLLARVLGGDLPARIDAVVNLSGWDESSEEYARRSTVAGQFGVPVIAPHGTHTHADAVQCMLELKTEMHIVLVTSAYHQLRTFLTFLAVLKQFGLERSVRLWNASAPSSMEKLAAEWEKIGTYQAKGHVASYDEGLAYLDWRDA